MVAMYWELVPTAQGYQLFVDGVPLGAPSEPPPSGWLQRQYGVLMPPEYEQARLMCGGAVAGQPPYSSHGRPRRGSCNHLTPPFAPARPFRHGDCVWLEWKGWEYSPNNVPGAAGNMVLWSGQFDGLYGQPFVPEEYFLPSVYAQGYEEGAIAREHGLSAPFDPIAGARRTSAPTRPRDCYSKVTAKGLWVCCQKTCRLAVRTPL